MFELFLLCMKGPMCNSTFFPSFRKFLPSLMNQPNLNVNTLVAQGIITFNSFCQSKNEQPRFCSSLQQSSSLCVEHKFCILFASAYYSECKTTEGSDYAYLSGMLMLSASASWMSISYNALRPCRNSSDQACTGLVSWQITSWHWFAKTIQIMWAVPNLW